MPAAPRQNKKARKIAWKIIGIPANIRAIKSKKQQEIDASIVHQKTDRIK